MAINDNVKKPNNAPRKKSHLKRRKRNQKKFLRAYVLVLYFVFLQC